MTSDSQDSSRKLTDSTTARILLLEDDPEVRSILTQVLEDEDYLVVAVDRGEKAVQAAAEQAFDLIIADIRMEGMGGLEAIAQTRVAQPAIGTLVVSAYADPEETEKASQLGVGGYLRKPFRMEDLLLYVRSSLAAHTRKEEEQAGSDEPSFGPAALLQLCLEAADDPTRRVPPGTLRRVTELVEGMGRPLGLAADLRQEITVACGFMLAVRSDLKLDLWSGASDSLTTFRSVLAFAEEAATQDPPPPLDARLAALVVAAVRGEAQAGSAWALPDLSQRQGATDQLLEQNPHLDVELLELYLKYTGDGRAPMPVSRGGGDSEARARGMLALAKTLERSGNHGEALSAYQSLIERHAGGKEGVAARLALATLEPREDQLENLKSACLEAGRLGPVAAALTALEAGHHLFRAGRDEARDFLITAARSLEKLGFENALARAAVPLIALGVPLPPERLPRVVRALLSQEEREDTLRNGPWLFPLLFEHLPPRPGSDLYSLLAGVAERFSAIFCQLLRDGELGEEASIHLVDSLLQGSRDIPKELGELLMSDERDVVALRARRLQERMGSGESLSMLRIRSFGVLEVSVGDRPIEGSRWKTQKNRYLFAYLASRWGRAVPEETLRDLFWPDSLERGRQRVYWATSVLRGCLAGDAKPDSPILERSAETLRLDPEVARWHDLEEFHRLLTKSREFEAAGEGASARPLYRRLARLHRGPYLDGCYMDWAIAYRESLERQTGDALVRLARLAHDAKDYREASEASKQALELDPCRQDAALIAMEAGTDSGKPDQAQAIYEQVEKDLRVDLGLEPNTELIRELYRARMGVPDTSGENLIG